ncbi:guanitoxin biosynthesis heme-dependent pre-guanitoxin N-hydroxylase GntA [Parapedobacter sp. 10938]|uniref:guanitoxin biosynthesis heme-dependent pre-guanitoxin N-hydroxylase GntA n=1 Tax=Parapedobacter flavus TaxID=3110225 RepID=UPI002DBC0954|nr:guanitoxin biosynthesis heme-dependent pre-guanitoxin N-hydroxylase GntA [Parapedobacter sp. 10938]MEC3878014.1 guanitoxin biosynthesis heme-dependent pre-guanitoxin N-hydroxylase GntA [Parapedobacter sp. 10938]
MEIANPKQSYYRPDEACRHPESRIGKINKEFIQRIDAKAYPCVGAKSALHTHQYRLGSYGRMGTPTTTMCLAEDLKTYIRETRAADSHYMTMVAVFTDEINSEIAFEQKLWMQLQKLHDVDGEAPWDPAVGKDPEDKDFSFSFHGSAFFIVGLHPHASRKARQFGHPAMAFNLHRQFEQLRAAGTYEKMKTVIREREIAYHGSINPMLSDHGQGSEAPQYSGRKVSKQWKCPFHRH